MKRGEAPSRSLTPPGSALLAQDLRGTRPHLVRDPARAPRVEVEVDPVLAELGRELARPRVVHPVHDPHRRAADVHEAGADEDPIADPELAPEPALELEGREADAVLAEVGGGHAEPGDDVHVGVGEAMEVEGHAHVPEDVDLPRLDGVAARVDEPRLVAGGGARLVGRAVPLHQARFDGPAERRGHRDRLPGVEVHVPLRDGEGRAETAARRVEELVAGAHGLPFAADESALDVDDVALQELRLEAADGRHRGEGAPVVPGVGGPGSHLVEQVEDAVGDPLEVVGDGEVLEGVAFPRLHHSAKGLAPAVPAHPSNRLRVVFHGNPRGRPPAVLPHARPVSAGPP